MNSCTECAYSPTWEEIDEVIAKYTTVDMAKRLLELERAVRDFHAARQELPWNCSAMMYAAKPSTATREGL